MIERFLDTVDRIYMNLTDGAIYLLESRSFWKVSIIALAIILVVAGIKYIFKTDRDPFRDDEK